MELFRLGLISCLALINGLFYLVPVRCLVDDNRIERRQILLVIDIYLHHPLSGRLLVDLNAIALVCSILLCSSMGVHGVAFARDISVLSSFVTDICVGLSFGYGW